MKKCFCGKVIDVNKIICDKCHSNHEIDDILGE